MPVVPFLPAIAGVAGAALGANAQNKASKQAANASQQASDQAIAEQRRQYDQSRADQAPWLQAGQGALAQLSQLYNLNGQGAQQGFNWQGYLQANPDVQQAIAAGGFGGPGGAAGAAERHWNEYGKTEQRAQPVAASNMDSFFASPDYQFRQNEQMRALTARNAALGIQDSGAAQRSALQLSGNLASGEFNNFANRLSGIAGVGQTAANQNQQAGQQFGNAFANIVGNNAQNLASSYQQQGANNANLYGNIAGIGAGLFNQYAMRR